MNRDDFAEYYAKAACPTIAATSLEKREMEGYYGTLLEGWLVVDRLYHR
jgi:hypothetical protein